MQNLCEILNSLVVGAECKMREVQTGSFFMLDNLSTNLIATISKEKGKISHEMDAWKLKG